MLIAMLLVAAALPAEWTLAGQEATCGHAARPRKFELKSEERLVELGNGLKLSAMTLGGRLAPVLEACEGDAVTLRVTNAGEMAHGIDSHALRLDTRKFGPADPGSTLVLSAVVTTPGAFMFHCAAGPVTDVHIKSGMWGAMIVYPRKRLPKAHEVAILQGGIFGKPGEGDVIHGDPAMMMRNEPYTLTFNGRLEHEAVRVKAGELIRIWFVNAGPGIASPHVMGTLFDRVAASGNPKNLELDVQTALVPAGGGAMLELRLPEDGMYMFCDHDNLRFLPTGFAVPLQAGAAAAMPMKH